MPKKSPWSLVRIVVVACLLAAGTAFGVPPTWITYEAQSGPGGGKHIVFLVGDEEYRSEEALPMLAKILSQRHGFKCTVLFSVDDNGTIHPNKGDSLSHPEALDSADAIVMALRFRHWHDDASRRFAAAVNRGVPIVALRTSTHAFSGYAPGSEWEKWNFNRQGGFGKQALGETWINHWGKHKFEATRGVIEASAKEDPILRGVTEVFGDTDVYEAYPPADAKILLRGLVLQGMKPGDAPADYTRKRTTDQQVQAINNPAMPIAWTRLFSNEAGKQNKIFCTTMGAATDLQNEGLRRLVVNSVFWGLGFDVPAKANVDYVDGYQPRFYGFNGFRPGLTAADHALGKVLAPGTAAPPPVPPKQSQPKNEGAGVKSSTQPALQLKPGDHIALVGNAVADRMQHHGGLETLIVAKFPEHNLVFRNLGFSGDEVAGFLDQPDPVRRHRSENFGSNDDWLKRVQADVIFAFFGFNESFAGEAGLPKFKRDLATFLQETKDKNYSGKSPPRVVLFSPLAAESSNDPNQPETARNNANLKLYTAAMAEVARDQGVPFVDLFTLSQSLYAEAATQQRSLTFNTIHLTESGDRKLAPEIFRALFGEAAPPGDHEKLRAAINEKNAEWHARYRTVDGYNVYGGRSKLEFRAAAKAGRTEAEDIKGGSKRSPTDPKSPKISNYEVMQEEMVQRDAKTANRDRRVWAVARGGDLKVDDANLPPLTAVPPNKLDAAPYLDGEEAIQRMTVATNCRVILFADEKRFPELVNPVQMAWDTRGRLWVAVWPSYPERTPTSKSGDSLLIFEDTDGDGRADKCIHFLDNLNCPTGFQFYKDGVLVVQAPDLWWVRDRNGDDQPDSMERVLGGIDSADSHHTANSLVLDPGGATYLSDGVFHRAQTETAEGVVRNVDAAIYRYEPRTHKYERYIAYNFANPHGRVFDYWGNDLVTDATGNANYFGPAFSGFIDFPAKHPDMEEFWKRPSRPCAGTGLVSSRHFPEDWQGNFLNCNVLGFRGIFRVKVTEDGSGLKGESLEDLVRSEDENFRPSSVSVAPDGSLYFLDWSQQLIGHMQHHIRDPNRDHTHGRIYRVTYEGRPLLAPVKIHGESIANLLAALKTPENDVRTRAKIELGKHDTAEVIAATKQWAASLDPKDPAYEHQMMEALWVHQWHNVVNLELLGRLLQSPEPQARAAATRVLCYWRDRVPNALALLQNLAADKHPRVRLEAIRAASFFRTADAADVALAALRLPTDYYLDYTLTETIRQLKPWWRQALADGQPVATRNPAGLDYLLQSLTAGELLKLPRTEAVQRALLTRPGVADALRAEVLLELANQRNQTRVTVLLDTFDSLDRKQTASMITIARMFPNQPPAELAVERSRIAKLTDSRTAEVRQSGWAALMIAAGSLDAVWDQAGKTSSQADLLAGLPLVLDQDLRNAAHARVQPLLSGDAEPAVRLAAIRATVSMPQHQAATFTALTRLIEKGEQVPAAATGLRTLPRAAWSKDQAGKAASALVAWARTVPADQRTSEDYIEAVQAATELAGLLPAGPAEAICGDLKGLRVAVYVIRTVREQMRYDTPRIVVAAGKPFELRIENTDFMPHNLVVVKPGAREKIGAITEKMKPETLDAQGRAFVPDLPEILAATALLEAGQKATLKFTAPTEEGDYEYVCTFPGHWQVMWGRLVVTRDVDAYLAQHPQAEPTTTATAAGHKHAEYE